MSRVILLCVMMGLLLAAAPSTQPGASGSTTKPAHKFTPPKSWPLIENKTYHFTLNVPDKWHQVINTDTQVTCMLPAPPRTRPDMFLIVSGKCHPTTTEDAAKLDKEDLLKQATIKILKDEATTWGDRPAWLLDAEAAVTVQPPPNLPKAKPMTVHTHMHKLVRVDQDVIYEVSIEALPASFDRDLSLFNNVMQTFTWTDNTDSSAKH